MRRVTPLPNLLAPTVLSRLALAGALSVPLGAPLAAQSMSDGFKSEIEMHFDGSARKVVMLAEAMPAEKYGWSPAEGVASVARVYLHIARYNYMYLEQNMGIASPVDRRAYMGWEADATARFQSATPTEADKEWVGGIVNASMTHVRESLDAMSDSDLTASTGLYGRQVQHWSVLLQLVAHMNEHLGQSIAYARMNGVVPPWSM